ncbi:MBL fold metallo-hydrolase [Kineosporia babensis]|uniref:MBL fold metallo-hydrolase n=1 Tax=Kineosporia babensis TaxID=499548 RepID=A0A9X1NN03_9ACTN|nr:MBL fold metallo-hydrolase [Kineosporia babensis]
MSSEPSPPPRPRVTWLGHSTVVLDLGGTRLITDPLLRRHNWPLRRRGERPSAPAWSRPDLVLLSHLHHDHAELSSLKLLAGVPVLTAPDNAAWLRRKGLSGIDDGGKWYDIPGTDVRVRLVRADHGHRPMPHRPNSANGHLVQTPGFTAYLAGDTSLYPELADLPKIADAPIDLAVVPIGGWGPRLSGGHMDSEQAAQAVALIGARVAVPVHWGTLHAPVVGRFPRGWMDVGGQLFTEALARHAPESRSLVLAPAGAADLPI